MALPRMRTIAEAMKHLKETDPGTELTEWALRGMVRSGRIPSNKVGKKYLINIDMLDMHLREDAASYSKPAGLGNVRRQELKLLG